jgi:RNA recognition motif-containing protein
MGKKIYVGNLPFTSTSDTLLEIFSPFGKISSSKIVLDRDSGRSKGFGFVEMMNDTEAQSAISELHGSQYGGRSLTVNEARPQAAKAQNHM